MINRLKEFGLVMWILIIFLFVGLVLGLGGLAYKATFGVKSANIDRQIYEESQSYVKGVAKDLSDYRFQLNKTDDPVERKAIIQLINSRFADFNPEQLNDPELAQFLRDVREGYIQ
nr:hypothetical protein 4 [Micrococcaceae bacterium]